MKNIKRLTLTLLSLFILINTNHAQVADTTDAKEYLVQAERSLQNGKYEQARDYSLKALNVKPNYGEAYFMIARIYIEFSKTCKDSYFMRDMIFCLVVDKLEMAKKVDPNVIDKANELIDRYSKYFPSDEVHITGEPIEGEKYKIGYWINEETTVRFYKK